MQRIARTVGPGLLAGCLVVVAATGCSSSSSDATSGSITGVQTYGDLARDHVAGAVTYPQSPPVGGAHSPVWQNCGVYDQPVANENAVHSLEHGAVWLAYQPTLPADDVASLRALAANQDHVLVSPYPDLPTPVVATGWGVQLSVADATDPRLRAFVEQYQSGPQSPERGVTCAGGTGTPL